MKLLQAFAIFNGQKTQVSNSTNVTAVIQDPNDSPPVFQLSTATATVNEGIGRGSLVPGLNMLVTDRDSVSIIIVSQLLFGRPYFSGIMCGFRHYVSY